MDSTVRPFCPRTFSSNLYAWSGVPGDVWTVAPILTICGWPGASIPSEGYITEVCRVAAGGFVPALMLAGVYPQATTTNVKTVPSREKLNLFTHSIPIELTGLERGATIRLPASIVSDHSATSGDARCRRCTACTGLFLLVSLGAVRSESG